MVTETAVLSSLIYNEEYARKVMPYLDREYFPGVGQQVIFKLVRDHFLKYNKIPSKDILQIEIENSSLSENIYERTIETFEELKETEFDIDWLVDNTEVWCQKQALFNAISKSASLLEEKDNTNYGKALELVQDALSVNFDHDLGHDYIEDSQSRYKSYKDKLSHHPCGLHWFDTTTLGGFVAPSLTVFIAPSGVGKSFMLCQLAASYLAKGKSVLYITLEMSVKETAKRIDANLLDISPDDLEEIDESSFMKRINMLKMKTVGKLIIKEYPANTVHAGHFRHAIRELKLKKKFVPDILIIDYLGLTDSMRNTKNSNLFEQGKNVSTEIRALGQEFGIPVFTAAQINRDGTRNGDFEVTDIAESWAIVNTADYVYGLITNEDLRKLNQMMVKRLKDRYKDYRSYIPRFNIGVDYTRMRFYNVDANTASSSEEPKKQEKQEQEKPDVTRSKFDLLKINNDE